MGRRAIVLVLGLTACHHRAILGLDLGAAGSFGDGPIVLPDRGVAPRHDGSTPEVCLHEPSLRLVGDPAGVMTLALSQPGAVATPVTISGATSGEGALAVDLAPVAAIAAVRPGVQQPTVELAAIQKRFTVILAASQLGGLSVRASGTAGKNHSGQPDVKEAIWDLEAAGSVEPATIRAHLLAAVLDRPLSALALPMTPVSGPSAQLTVKLTVARQGDALATSAAVANRSELDGSDEVAFAVDDLANGTALAGPKRGVVSDCDVGIVDGSAMADILWVIDESGSMSDNRADIVAHAN